jgi:hypothetical protein
MDSCCLMFRFIIQQYKHNAHRIFFSICCSISFFYKITETFFGGKDLTPSLAIAFIHMRMSSQQRISLGDNDPYSRCPMGKKVPKYHSNFSWLPSLF